MSEKNGQNEKNTFEFTYSAPTEREKKQILSIRKQYEETKECGEDAFARIKALDAKVKNTAICVSLILGIVGCLTFGLGLTMILEWNQWTWGIVLMVVGCIPMAFAYPAHHWLFARGKRKYSAEIIRLSDELLKR